MEHKLKLEEVLNRIESAFSKLFKEHNFSLKKSDPQEIVYENDYSEIIFDFDNYGTRFSYLAPAIVYYKNKANHHQYTIKSIVEKLQNLDFEKLFQKYYETRKLDYYECYKEIIQSNLNDILKDANFFWAKKIEDINQV